jgi:hypothetical protein
MLFLLVLALLTAGWFGTGYINMLFVGNLHNWWDFIPSMGYTEALLVWLPVYVGAVIAAGIKDSSKSFTD